MYSSKDVEIPVTQNQITGMNNNACNQCMAMLHVQYSVIAKAVNHFVETGPLNSVPAECFSESYC